jgi:hypothetical protein
MLSRIPARNDSEIIYQNVNNKEDTQLDATITVY